MEQAKNKSREDKDFVKFYRKFIRQIADLSMDNPTALTVLLFLIRNMDGFNALGVSTQVIADFVGFSRQTVSKNIKYLKEHGWLEVYKQGTCNIYVINPDVAWTSYADQKQYCKFAGSFMLSGEENWELLQNPKAKNQYKFIDTEFVNNMAEKHKEFQKKAQSFKEEQVEGQMELPPVEVLPDWVKQADAELEAELKEMEEGVYN